MTAIETAKLIAKTLDDKKGLSIRVLEIGKLSSLTEYFVIVSGTSDVHVKALADEVDKVLGEQGRNPERTEGYRGATWILMDYGDVILHIFHRDTREFYKLEKLWADAPQVDLSDCVASVE